MEIEKVNEECLRKGKELAARLSCISTWQAARKKFKKEKWMHHSLKESSGNAKNQAVD
jgi:hypothetical protein